MSNVFDYTMPGGGRMPNVGAMPKVDTVDVLCGGAMPHVGCMPKDVGAMPKGWQHT